METKTKSQIKREALYDKIRVAYAGKIAEGVAKSLSYELTAEECDTSVTTVARVVNKKGADNA